MTRAQRIRDGKRMCRQNLAHEAARGHQGKSRRRRIEEEFPRQEQGEQEFFQRTQTEAEEWDSDSEFRDLPIRIAAACAIFLLLLFCGRYSKVLEEERVQAWVQENHFYEEAVETTAQAVRKWLPGEEK